jgi:DNA-directed RNA polymerase subunit RPC12/RpoP
MNECIVCKSKIIELFDIIEDKTYWTCQYCNAKFLDKKDYDGTLYLEHNIYLGREEGSSFSDTNTGFMSSKFKDIEAIVKDMRINEKYNYKSILKTKDRIDMLTDKLREEKKKLRNITI